MLPLQPCPLQADFREQLLHEFSVRDDVLAVLLLRLAFVGKCGEDTFSNLPRGRDDLTKYTSINLGFTIVRGEIGRTTIADQKNLDRRTDVLGELVSVANCLQIVAVIQLMAWPLELDQQVLPT